MAPATLWLQAGWKLGKFLGRGAAEYESSTCCRKIIAILLLLTMSA
jgi:hypothetical protein